MNCGGGAVAVGCGWADACGVQGRVVAACQGWHAFGAVRGAVLGGCSTALSRMGLRPGAALHDRVPRALRVGLSVLFRVVHLMDLAFVVVVDSLTALVYLSLGLAAMPLADGSG